MKKAIALLTVLFCITAVLSGCGGAKRVEGTSFGTAVESGGVAAPANNQAGGIYKTPGNELTDFSNAFQSAVSVFEEATNGLEDFDALTTQLSVVSAYMPVYTVAMYDLLDSADKAHEEGTLMLSGYEAVRDKAGTEITFSGNAVLEEDSPTGAKAGDKLEESGSLNTETNTFTYLSTATRGESVVSRSAIQICMSGDTWVFQYIASNNPAQDERGNNLNVAVFERFNQTEQETIVATHTLPTDFTPAAISADSAPDQMAEGFTGTGRITVQSNEAAYQSL